MLCEVLALERRGVPVDLYPLLRERARLVHPEAAPVVGRARYCAVPVAGGRGEPALLAAPPSARLPARVVRRAHRDLGQPELLPGCARLPAEGRPRGPPDAGRRRHPRALPLRQPSRGGGARRQTADRDAVQLHRARLRSAQGPPDARPEGGRGRVRVNRLGRQPPIDRPGVRRAGHREGARRARRRRHAPVRARGRTRRVRAADDPVRGDVARGQRSGVPRRGVPAARGRGRRGCAAAWSATGPTRPRCVRRSARPGWNRTSCWPARARGRRSRTSCAVRMPSSPRARRPGTDAARACRSCSWRRWARACPSSRARSPGIPELVEHEVGGLLVPPATRRRSHGAVARLAADPALRARLGDAARRRVLAEFDLESSAAVLARRFGAEAAA